MTPVRASVSRGLVGGGSRIRTLSTAAVACQMSSCTRIAGVVETDHFVLCRVCLGRGKLTIRPFVDAKICTATRISAEPSAAFSSSFCLPEKQADERLILLPAHYVNVIVAGQNNRAFGTISSSLRISSITTEPSGRGISPIAAPQTASDALMENDRTSCSRALSPCS
jgi:hypothetical protein